MSAATNASAPKLFDRVADKSHPQPLDELVVVAGGEMIPASTMVPASAPSIAATPGQSGMQRLAVVDEGHESGPRTVAKWSNGVNVVPSSSDAPTMNPLDSTEHA
jgi:hypothetical protein